ncbi:MAG: hypothetical protein ACOX45_08050 [Acutalibacteraceae bacterium]|jgi:hypothetical protein
MLIVATNYFETAKTTNNSTTKAESIKRGLQFLGYSLHPLQDSYAHTRDRCHKVCVYQPLYDVYGNFMGYHTLETPYWSHFVKNDTTDVVAVRSEQLGLTRDATISILYDVYKIYKKLF